MSTIVLGLWAVTAAFGVVALTRWVRRRRPGSHFPVRLVVSHVGTATLTVASWIVFMATSVVAWAWVAMAIVTVNNVLGDRILTGRFRAVNGSRSGRDYGQAVLEILRFRRPLASGHALIAGVMYFTTLATCIIETLRRT